MARDQVTTDRPRLRGELREEDRSELRALAAGTDFFNAGELDVVSELVDLRLRDGDASGYHFKVLDVDAGVAAFACYGQIPATDERYDLYWLVVHRERHRQGLGRRLLDEVERDVRERGGRRLYVETSSRELYAPTRAFYAGVGYEVAGELADFYRRGDGKTFFLKVLAPDG